MRSVSNLWIPVNIFHDMFSCTPARTLTDRSIMPYSCELPLVKVRNIHKLKVAVLRLFFPGDCSWLSLHQLFSKLMLSLPLFVQFKLPCWWVNTPADSSLPTGDMRYVLWGREKHEPAGSYRAGALKDTKQLDCSLPQMEQQQPISSRNNFPSNPCCRLFRLQRQVSTNTQTAVLFWSSVQPFHYSYCRKPGNGRIFPPHLQAC